MVILAVVERTANDGKLLSDERLILQVGILVKTALSGVHTLLTQACDDLTHVCLRLKVVNAVHHQDVGRGLHRAEDTLDTVKEGARLLGLGRDVLGVTVEERHKGGGGLAAVRPFPDKFGRQTHAAQLTCLVQRVFLIAATENEMVDAKARKDLRNLRGETKLIGHIAHLAASAEGVCDLTADLQVADCCLAAGEVKIVLQIPRANADVAACDIFFKHFPSLGVDLEVILKDHGLRIEMEDVFGILLNDLKQMLDQINELLAEQGEGHIPFPIPVRVRNDKKLFHRRLLLFSDYIIKQRGWRRKSFFARYI